MGQGSGCRETRLPLSAQPGFLDSLQREGRIASLPLFYITN